MKIKLSVVLMVVFLSSCARYSAGRQSTEINKISIGMSKAEVIATIGMPSRTSANLESEYLIYNLVDEVDNTNSITSLGLLPPSKIKTDYFVKIQKNKVISYGRVGDFDSDKIPDNH